MNNNVLISENVWSYKFDFLKKGMVMQDEVNQAMMQNFEGLKDCVLQKFMNAHKIYIFTRSTALLELPESLIRFSFFAEVQVQCVSFSHNHSTLLSSLQENKVFSSKMEEHEKDW